MAMKNKYTDLWKTPILIICKLLMLTSIITYFIPSQSFFSKFSFSYYKFLICYKQFQLQSSPTFHMYKTYRNFQHIRFSKVNICILVVIFLLLMRMAYILWLIYFTSHIWNRCQLICRSFCRVHYVKSRISYVM